MAAAAFSCCAIERTRTDDERDEREEEEDEIVVAANDDDEDAKPRRRRGPGERATAEAPPRRGAAGAADDEAHAQAGPREDARERDDAVIVIVRTRKKLDKERGKKERRKSVWSSVSRFRRARLSLKPRKKLSSRLNEISLPLFSRSRSLALFLWLCTRAALSRQPCWPRGRCASPACSRAAPRGAAAARRRHLPPRRRWPLCHDESIAVVASMFSPALLLRRRPLRPSPPTRRPRPPSPRPRR